MAGQVDVTHKAKANTTRTVLIRRVNRVRRRWRPNDDTVDEMLDDFFVLWRAYEATFSPGQTSRNGAVLATVEAIDYVSFPNLPETRAWARALRHFSESIPQLSQWFGRDSLTSVQAKELTERISRVVNAADVPDRWHSRDSRHLAHLLYDMRCAIIHPALETSNALALRILTPLRRCLVELVMARAARDVAIDYTAARALFDNDLLA